MAKSKTDRDGVTVIWRTVKAHCVCCFAGKEEQETFLVACNCSSGVGYNCHFHCLHIKWGQAWSNDSEAHQGRPKPELCPRAQAHGPSCRSGCQSRARLRHHSPHCASSFGLPLEPINIYTTTNSFTIGEKALFQQFRTIYWLFYWPSLLAGESQISGHT